MININESLGLKIREPGLVVRYKRYGFCDQSLSSSVCPPGRCTAFEIINGGPVVQKRFRMEFNSTSTSCLTNGVHARADASYYILLLYTFVYRANELNVVKHDCVRLTFLGTRMCTFFSKQWTVKNYPKNITRMRTFFSTMLPFIDRSERRRLYIRIYFFTYFMSTYREI